MKKYLLPLIVCFLFVSCYTTPSSTIANGVDFSKFQYASIGSDVSGGSSIMDAHMKLQNSLISCGYKIVGDTRIEATLSPEDISKLFIVTAGISSSSDESVCTINITDYLSGYLLATCKGSFGFGFSITDDQNGAIDSAIKQMENVIRK